MWGSFLQCYLSFTPNIYCTSNHSLLLNTNVWNLLLNWKMELCYIPWYHKAPGMVSHTVGSHTAPCHSRNISLNKLNDTFWGICWPTVHSKGQTDKPYSIFLHSRYLWKQQSHLLLLFEFLAWELLRKSPVW